ncbi:tRNA modification GTPase MnmE [uncultured Desulfobacterium sp.]|uniref:tRNA modification GTPase MnmE n=1 Tax=uncultured Desulfobacterium sp. TaxID=201089 RepID=A0A445N383_9BACT|nr:tRNA modification GTPase MnmE [uncultured Desulfobacterium sp.]
MNNGREIKDAENIFSDPDTIAAIATPIGQAGIGIIRISGPLSLDIARKIFRPKNSVENFKSHFLYLGEVYDPSSMSLIDEVLLSYMKAPHSYTREDVIEINSHSGYLILSMILQVVIDEGARLARPGEFTFRAFLNGRIDLTQAEAVMNLINSQSSKGLHLACQQVQGVFRQQIEILRQRVVDMLAQVEVAIDFPEADVEILSRVDAVSAIKKNLLSPVKALIAAHSSRSFWIDGVNTVIAGRVNAGKSSLFNRLLNEQRAIVTSVPGTTRDVIGSHVSVNGVPLRLMDTAGFGHTRDEVDRIGVQLAEQKMMEADFVMVVIDQSRPLNDDDLGIIKMVRGKSSLMVINKIDLPCALDQGSYLDGLPIVRISALTGQGIDDLKKTIVQCFLKDDMNLVSSNVVPNVRHKKALVEAEGYFNGAMKNLEKDSPMEVVAVELKSGLDALGEIIGETTGEEVWDSIFSQFCLGK